MKIKISETRIKYDFEPNPNDFYYSAKIDSDESFCLAYSDDLPALYVEKDGKAYEIDYMRMFEHLRTAEKRKEHEQFESWYTEVKRRNEKA